MSRSLLIINPIAGGGKPAPLAKMLVDELEPLGPVDVFYTSARGDAERASKSAVNGDYSRVVVVGGDGTINEAVNGLANSSIPLGIVPLGTGNVLARELKLPIDDPSKAVEIIRNGAIRRIDLGQTDARYFVAMAGLGFDAAVVYKLDLQMKKMIGVGAYGLAIMSELMKGKPALFSLRIDEIELEIEAFMVIIANSSSYAYGIKVAAEAKMDDGLLDVVVFVKADSAKLALLHQALRVITKTHLDDPNILQIKAKVVEIKSKPDVFIQLDGDVIGETPVRVEVAPQALSLIAPSE